MFIYSPQESELPFWVLTSTMIERRTIGFQLITLVNYATAKSKKLIVSEQVWTAFAEAMLFSVNKQTSYRGFFEMFRHLLWR